MTTEKPADTPVPATSFSAALRPFVRVWLVAFRLAP